MKKEEQIIARLRVLEQQRGAVTTMEQALQALTPEERLVTDMLLIRRQKGNIKVLCELLAVDERTIYRRRRSALNKLSAILIHSN